jgi:hypothetical protein
MNASTGINMVKEFGFSSLSSKLSAFHNCPEQRISNLERRRDCERLRALEATVEPTIRISKEISSSYEE